MQPLIDAGVLEAVRAGAGKNFTLRDPETLAKFIDRQYPGGLTEDETDDLALDRRTQALARFRDTKALGGLDFEIVEYRLTGVQPLRVGACEVFGRDQLTGLGALVLHDRRRVEFPIPAFSGHVATVENPTVFISYPWQQDAVDLVILTYGRMSRRLVDWLGGETMASATVTHYGDYDPVGLCEFLRLREQLGDRAALYLPDNLDALFKRFNNRELLTRSTSLLPRLSNSGDQNVLRVLRLMREVGGGLEHEVLVNPSLR
jgi:hypothetical protein